MREVKANNYELVKVYLSFMSQGATPCMKLSTIVGICANL